MAKENIAATNQKEKLYYGNYDDVLFSALDIAVEGRDAGEVALNFGKAALSNSISAGLGAAAKGLSGLADKIGSAAGRTAVKAGIAGGSAYITKVSNSYISSVDYSAEGGWTMDWEKANSSWHSKETIAATLGAGISAGMTAGLNEANLFDSNKTALNSRTFNTDAISKFNSLAGGLSSSAVSFAITGEVTFNVLNLTDFGTKINGGLLELTYNKDKGFSSRIGNGGTDLSLRNTVTAVSGIKEATKVAGWKYGGAESKSTLNGVNMLGYTDSGMNRQLAKEIWDERLAVEYGDTGDTYGSYTQGDNKILLSETLLGGGREETTKLSSVMSHEGTHYYGNRIEGIANISAAGTYSQLNQMFNLQADTTFSTQMLAGIINAENWEMNTGDVDYWKMTWGGQLVSDGSGWLKDENGMYISMDGARTEKPIQGETLGAAYQEAGLLNIMAGTSGERWSSFTEEEQQQAQQIMKGSGLVMDKNGQWNYAKGKKLDMADIMAAAGESIANPVFETYYNNKVDYDLVTAWNMDLRFSETAMNKTVPESLQGRYSELITQHLQETDSPEALKDKYTWNIYNKKGIATELFKIDENNSFLDELVKQTAPELNSTINKYGCNFMSTIAFPQLLTGNILDTKEIQTIWNESIKQKYTNQNNEVKNWIDSADSNVNNPDKVADYTLQKLGFPNFELRYGWSGNNFELIGNKVKVPYSNTGHWLLSDQYFRYLYNPANTTGINKDYNSVYLRKN